MSNHKSGRDRRDALGGGGGGGGGGLWSADPNHPCLHFVFVSSTPFLTEVRARLSTLERLGWGWTREIIVFEERKANYIFSLYLLVCI